MPGDGASRQRGEAMRGRRYWQRTKSKNVYHKRALISLERRAAYRELVKLGKIDPTARRTKGKK